MSRFLKTLVAVTLIASPAFAEKLDLGRTATPAEIKAWDIDVRPDGMGLPEGSGSVTMGEEIFVEKCASCHGDFGEAVGRWPVLAGGHGTLASEDPVKTIGSYWPYLSTVWDYVHRAMPFGNAQSLTDDEVYAIVAYILYVNDTVDDEDFVLSKANFLTVEQENADGFFMDDRDKTEYPVFRVSACMENCKQTVEITSHARVVDVTPDEVKAEPAKNDEMPAPVVEATEATLDADLVKKGAKVFKKCKACHKVGDKAKNGVGPILNGVYNASAGHNDAFKYSSSLRKASDAGLVWDDETLRAFLKKPKSVIAKTKMSFAGLKKDKDLDAIVEYLKSVSQ